MENTNNNIATSVESNQLDSQNAETTKYYVGEDCL